MFQGGSKSSKRGSKGNSKKGHSKGSHKGYKNEGGHKSSYSNHMDYGKNKKSV